MARSSSTFKTGHSKVGGRQRGTLNRRTVALQQLKLIDDIGSDLLQILNEIGPAKWFMGLKPSHQVRLVIAAMETQNLNLAFETDQLTSLLRGLQLDSSIVSAERESIKNQNVECPDDDGD